MPRQAVSTVQNQFVRGLITEATGLNFPEDAAHDALNVRFGSNGEVTRRFGFDLEEGFSTRTIDRSTVVVNAYLWEAAAGDGTNTFAVIQIGASLYFYDATEDTLSNGYIESLALGSHSSGGSGDIEDYECVFSSGDGVLFVAHPYMETLYISYDAAGSPKFTATEISIEVRDTQGLDDGLGIEESPSSLSDDHKYNLFNQGWYGTQITSDTRITAWNTEFSEYPSNAHVWWLYKDSSDTFTPSLAEKIEAGNAPAPRGRFILTLYNQDRAGASGISGLTATTSGDLRAATVAFFAGRAWYSGVVADDYTNSLYFSQIAENEIQYGRCYQSADPTAEDRFELNDADGGVVTIPDAGQVIHIHPLGQNLVVFASNGIWAISGSEGTGFKATGYSINQVSRIRALSPSSFVAVENTLMFWSEDGIYQVTPGQFGQVDVQDITKETIKTLYDEIPVQSKKDCHVAYNRITNEIQWVYRKTEGTTKTERYTFDRILSLNTRTGSFYPFEIDTTAASVNAILSVEGYKSSRLGGSDVKAMCMIPAAGEFVYDTVEVRVDAGNFTTFTTNRHVGTPAGEDTEFTASLSQLQRAAPNLENISLFVAWFGDDLRCAECDIKPKTDNADLNATIPYTWTVAGLDRTEVEEVSSYESRAAYGGTPSDASVKRAIQEMNARGIGVTFNPFLLMDIPEGNGLPDPYGGAEQEEHPWRGRVTIYPAIGELGTPDKSASAATQIDAFMESTWGYRNFILHYAQLCSDAGGVDTFIIGSEMRGVSWPRENSNTFPFVTQLKILAADVKTILPNANVVYAADWSEFIPYAPSDGSSDVYFHLDPLWSDSNIDAIGIDNYWPLSDWRDGTTHLDYVAGTTSIYSLDYLRGNIDGGEGYDYYYASEAARDSQTRTNITDGAHSKPWVFRFKDIKNWWQNLHYNRPGGTEIGTSTDWTAESKPIWFMELGCPAVDKATNQPNVFYDPKSSESFFPYYSDESLDETIQKQFLKAYFGYYDTTSASYTAGNNPSSSVYSGTMVDLSRIYLYTWDARPYPLFPDLTVIWSDAANWEKGHWLTGRIRAPGLSGDPQSKSSVFKYLSSFPVSSSYSVTFADEAYDGFLDWVTVDGGEDYSSYFVTGFSVHGDGQRKFQPHYVFMYTTDDGSQYEFSSVWDYAKTDATGRYSQKQKVNHNRPNRYYDFKKLKVRGHGRACQFKVNSITGFPFTVIGWSQFETINSSI